MTQLDLKKKPKSNKREEKGKVQPSIVFAIVRRKVAGTVWSPVVGSGPLFLSSAVTTLL